MCKDFSCSGLFQEAGSGENRKEKIKNQMTVGITVGVILPNPYVSKARPINIGLSD